MFCNRARNKSSASDRSGFLGFIVHPPRPVRADKTYSLNARNLKPQNCKLFHFEAWLSGNSNSWPSTDLPSRFNQLRRSSRTTNSSMARSPKLALSKRRSQSARERPCHLVWAPAQARTAQLSRWRGETAGFLRLPAPGPIFVRAHRKTFKNQSHSGPERGCRPRGPRRSLSQTSCWPPSQLRPCARRKW